MNQWTTPACGRSDRITFPSRVPAASCSPSQLTLLPRSLSCCCAPLEKATSHDPGFDNKNDHPWTRIRRRKRIHVVGSLDLGSLAAEGRGCRFGQGQGPKLGNATLTWLNGRGGSCRPCFGGRWQPTVHTLGGVCRLRPSPPLPRRRPRFLLKNRRISSRGNAISIHGCSGVVPADSTTVGERRGLSSGLTLKTIATPHSALLPCCTYCTKYACRVEFLVTATIHLPATE